MAGRRQRSNVEDRRARASGAMALGVGATLLILFVAMHFSADPRELLQQALGLDTSTPVERVRGFRKGLKTRDFPQGDTFNEARLQI